MKTPTVSVIIPTYKRGHLLKHVLEALTNQSCQDFEVLMIVKPSGDTTEEVIKEYREKLGNKSSQAKSGLCNRRVKSWTKPYTRKNNRFSR